MDRSRIELNNYRAFHNLSEWEDVDGDGQIIVGAEQYPGCLNPVTECANSSWYVWAAETQTLPGIWRTTNDALYELTEPGRRRAGGRSSLILGSGKVTNTR